MVQMLTSSSTSVPGFIVMCDAELRSTEDWSQSE